MANLDTRQSLTSEYQEAWDLFFSQVDQSPFVTLGLLLFRHSENACSDVFVEAISGDLGGGTFRFAGDKCLSLSTALNWLVGAGYQVFVATDKFIVLKLP